MDTIKNSTGLYLLTCGNALSSWKKWQESTFAVAQSLDRTLFTRQGIMDLYRELTEFASAFRNYVPGSIREPDFDLSEKYNTNVWLAIGEGCSLAFIPVAGFYQGAGLSYGIKAQMEESK